MASGGSVGVGAGHRRWQTATRGRARRRAGRPGCTTTRRRCEGAGRNGTGRAVSPQTRVPACSFFVGLARPRSRRANGRPVLVTRTATRDATASGWAGPAASRTADRRGTSSGANAETEKKRTARLVFRGASATATDTKMEQPVAPYAAEQQLVRKEKKNSTQSEERSNLAQYNYKQKTVISATQTRTQRSRNERMNRPHKKSGQGWRRRR